MKARRQSLTLAGWVTLLLTIALWVAPIHAVVFEPLEFDTSVQERRYRALISELRCLVCQNQNLADSASELAGDLRGEVYRMIDEGHDDAQIVEFMVARYGDFVLYRPPWKLSTVLLWLAPAALTLFGAALAFRAVARGRHRSVAQLSESERERVNRLVSGDSDRG